MKVYSADSDLRAGEVWTALALIVIKLWQGTSDDLRWWWSENESLRRKSCVTPEQEKRLIEACAKRVLKLDRKNRIKRKYKKKAKAS